MNLERISILPNFIFTAVNLDPIVIEEKWTDGESWPNDFVEKVNRCEDLSWVGSDACISDNKNIILTSLEKKSKQDKFISQIPIASNIAFTGYASL